MIQYPAVCTLSCSFSTAFWLPNIRKENLFTPGCIMAPNCRCINPDCLDAASISSKPTMASSRSPLPPTELAWSFMFWLPMLFFKIESCLWNTLFPSTFSSLLLENELDLSSMAVSERAVSGCGGQATRKSRKEQLAALLFHWTSLKPPLPPVWVLLHNWEAESWWTRQDQLSWAAAIYCRDWARPASRFSPSVSRTHCAARICFQTEMVPKEYNLNMML